MAAAVPRRVGCWAAAVDSLVPGCRRTFCHGWSRSKCQIGRQAASEDANFTNGFVLWGETSRAHPCLVILNPALWGRTPRNHHERRGKAIRRARCVAPSTGFSPGFPGRALGWTCQRLVNRGRISAPWAMRAVESRSLALCSVVSASGSLGVSRVVWIGWHFWRGLLKLI